MADKSMREQYLDKEVSFTEFYRSVNQVAGITLKTNRPLISKIKAALAEGDFHLNTIPLASWDMLAASRAPDLSRALKEHGDLYSMAGGVCAMKQAARDAAA